MEKPVRMLIADDQRPIREWVRSKLCSSARFEIVAEAGDGYETVAKAEALNPDVVLLDIGMPGLNGIETATLLRSVVPQAKIIFLSQNADPDVIRKALNDGARGFVLKCKAESDLLPAIHTVLLGETFSSDVLGDVGGC